MKNAYSDDYIDPMLLDAALAGRLRHGTITMTATEKVWLVGKLSERGETIPSICIMLHMSRRTAQRLRARYTETYM